MAPRDLLAQAQHRWHQHFCPHPAKCLLVLPIDTPPIKKGAPQISISHLEEDCLSHGKPTHCMVLPQPQPKPPNYGHAEEDKGSARHCPGCLLLPDRPPSIRRCFRFRRERGKKGMHMTRLFPKKAFKSFTG